MPLPTQEVVIDSRAFAGALALALSTPAFAQGKPVIPVQPVPSLAAALVKCQPAKDPVPPGPAYAGGLATVYAALTPAQLSGVSVVSPRAAKCLIDEMGERLLVIGTIGDAEGLTDSYKMPEGGSKGTFDDAYQVKFTERLTRFTGGDKTQPILIYCHSRECFLSYNGLLRAQHAGYRNLFWLRDGMKGWKDAGNKLGPMRTEYGSKTAIKVPSPTNWNNRVSNYPRPVGFGSDVWYAAVGKKRHELCRAYALGKMPFSDEDPYDRTWAKIALDGMAGVDPARDNEVLARRKVQTFWKQHSSRLDCGYYSFSQGSFLRAQANGLGSQDSRFYSDVVDWQVDLNDVDYRDGRTLLDFIADKYEPTQWLGGKLLNSQKSNLDRTYAMLRKGGAKHRAELEAEGKWPTAAQLQARFIAEHRAAAARGDLDSMGYLSNALFYGQHVAANPREAAQWVDRYEAAVIAKADGKRASSLGDAFMRGSALYPKNPQRAVRLYQLAARGGDGDAQLALGNALWSGQGIAQDQTAAVAIFKERWTDARPMKLVGDYYMAKGDRKTAAIYYRTAMRWTPNLDDQVNGYPAMIRWLRTNGFSPCGPLAGDQKPWKIEAEFGGC